ncbi:MAG: COG4315 family predicted lipoprotein [Streptosporangiaceae bacterium]
MRKSGWAVAAAGISSLVLLLTACGGSSSSSSSAAGNPGTTPTAGGQPSGGVSRPAAGTQVLIVERSKLGWVLAEASGFVVYTYGGDTKGGSPTCTGVCATLWPAVTGLPQAGPADTLPGTLGTVTMANGAKQITYNGYPLYTLKGAGALSTKGDGMDGKWHVIKLSSKDVTASF